MFKSSSPILRNHDYLIEPGPVTAEPKQGIPAVALSLFFAVAVLQILDGHSTYLAIAQGRAEMNPLILWLASTVGLLLAVGIAKALALVITGFYFKVSQPYLSKKRLLVPLACVVAAYTVVVINNYSN